MPFVFTKERSLDKALEDGGALIIDSNGNYISSKELNTNSYENANKFKYSLPIGADYKYFKVKPKGTDKWFVGYVKGKPIPKGTTGIAAQTAFAMMFGEELTNKGLNDEQWKKVGKDNNGEVIVKTDTPRPIASRNKEAIENKPIN